MKALLRPAISAIARLLLALALFSPAPVLAQELLLNRSFETPVVPTNGNNFYTSIADWTVVNVTPANPIPWNIIRPWSGYANNPTTTPTGGGIQYLDINSAAGRIVQTVTFPSAGMVDISGWFSVRDFSQVLTGLIINVRNSSGTVVATTNTSFAASDPIGLWKQATALNIPVDAGTHTFEVEIPNYANFDIASLVFKPALTFSKTSVILSDPINGASNPKYIPGAVAEYSFVTTSPSSYTVTNNSIAVTDTTPAGLAVVVADIAGGGSGPAAFVAGSSGLTYAFGGVGSTTDQIDFSNDGGATWTHVPVADANGADNAITTVRLRPQGTMAASSAFTFRMRYRIK
jgi:hypothetical protein